MLIQDNSYIINQELKDWEKRIWYPDLGRSFDNKDIPEWNQFYNHTNFKNLFTRDQDNIYRFLRYGISHGFISNTNIIFIRKSILKAYLMIDQKKTICYDYIDRFLNSSAKSYDNKYLVIQDLDLEFDDDSTIYLQNELKSRGCWGILYNCNPKYPNSFYQCTKDTECVTSCVINSIKEE